MTFAVVPAAGLSTRMGQPKLLLPLGGRPLLEHVVAMLRGGGVDTVLVIVGPNPGPLPTLAEAAGAKVLVLEVPTAEMRQTVERGLQWIEEQYHPPDQARWLLTPADHPGFSATTVKTVLEALPDAAATIVIPTYQGQRGHPVRFCWRHVSDIAALPPGVGVDALVRSVQMKTIEIAVNDPGILMNINRPDDYQRMLTAHGQAEAL